MDPPQKKRKGSSSSSSSNNKQVKKPNISKGTTANPISTINPFPFGSCGKQYKYQLCVNPEDQEKVEKNPEYKKHFMTAMVMHNDVCVLTAVNCIHIAEEDIIVVFHPSLSTDAISGRNKKGANLVKAGDIIITVTSSKTQEKIELRTPVGGKLLELNEQLLLNPKLVVTEKDNTGYVAVLHPNTDIPNLDDARDYESLAKKMEVKMNEKSICYAFLNKGNCARGDRCKFKHQRID